MESVKKRSDIEEKYLWKLEDIYQDQKHFDNDYRLCEELIVKMERISQRKMETPLEIKSCLDLYEEIGCLTENLYSYARMRKDEDNANPDHQVLAARGNQISVKAESATSFIEPLLLSMDEKLLFDPILDKYNKYIDDVIRKKAHTLSDKEERILAMSSDATDGAGEIFTMMNNADLVFPEILDENDEKVELTHGRYISFLENKNQRVRKDAFEAMYDTYASFKNTFTASYTSSIRVEKFYAKTKGYENSLQASLFQDHIDVEVYDQLIQTVHQNLSRLHRYVDVRGKILDLEKPHMYDLYVPLVEEENEGFSYETACKMVIEGLESLGTAYTDVLERAFQNRWIDVYETKGKTSGAYSWGTYLSHPFVLLNYQQTLDHVFTLAHEMGHSMHTYYANLNQPYIYSRYKIFVAEVASTVNEILLLKSLLKKHKDQKMRSYLINHFLESFRGTVFRQTMFAEFEKQAHEKYWMDQPLSCDDLCKMYLDLNHKYYGDQCVVDEKIKYEWCRIPHFYSSFYVYKYATGFSAAVAIANEIERKGKPAAERYVEFLRTGDKKYPLEALQIAGVDLSKPKPIEEGMALFAELLDEFEKLMR